MINFKDGILSEEEKELFLKKAKEHKEDEVIDEMDKEELTDVKEKIENKEINFEEKNNKISK